MIGTDKLSVYALLGISLGAGITLSLVVHFAVAPWLKKRILSKEQTAIHSSVADSESGEADANIPNLVVTEETSGERYVFFNIKETISRPTNFIFNTN